MMRRDYELLVIGAGPAGMAAAQSAARHGVEVAVVDEQAGAGGQIYRNVNSSPLADIGLLGKDYAFGLPLVQGFENARLDFFTDCPVWYLDKSAEIGVVDKGVHRQLNAQRVIIACGAQERAMPFPGWDMAGVMTAGAGQILMKSAAMVPDEAPVLAGSGPLLLLLAWQYLRAGVPVRAIVDTTPRASQWSALRHLPRALAACDYLFKGMRLAMAIRQARVPWYRRAGNLQAEGDHRLRALSFDCGGKRRRLETEVLMLHQGVVPAVHMAAAAACEINWNDAQQCWQPLVDDWGQSSQQRIFVAGDAAGIGGARAAWLGGQLAGLQVAHQLGHLGREQRDRLAGTIRGARDRHLAIRPFLDAYYRHDETAAQLPGETMACRCEEVPVTEISALAGMGCSGPNQAKAFTRCGMGPCQGRFCAATMESLFAREQGQDREQVGRFNARPPLKPVTLGQLADSDGENEDD